MLNKLLDRVHCLTGFCDAIVEVLLRFVAMTLTLERVLRLTPEQTS
jgi:hypothetical protein